MSFLLDTHTFIWASTSDDKLGRLARETILNAENELYLSVASIWEMSIKTSLGKLILQQPLKQIINEQIELNGYRI